jgi:integrase/recombinase XerD
MSSPKWIELFRRDLELKNYSKNTIDNYTSQVVCFLNRFSDFYEPSKINESNIKTWLLEAKSVNGRIHRLSALKLFYKYTIKQPMKLRHIEYPRAEKKLPQPLDVSEIQDIINTVSNIKHKSIICLLYSTGIRVGELINLKIEDIDSKRGVIHIMGGKGQKDRQVPLDNGLLSILRNYYRTYTPKFYLFNGQSSLQYSEKSINTFLKLYAKKAGIKRNIHAHLLRHSNATHMLESGVDISIIQKILGHNNLKTTQIYAKVSTDLLSKVKSPLQNICI